jgi:hypothetical protein
MLQYDAMMPLEPLFKHNKQEVEGEDEGKSISNGGQVFSLRNEPEIHSTDY